jgi:hypothetical protein
VPYSTTRSGDSPHFEFVTIGLVKETETKMPIWSAYSLFFLLLARMLGIESPASESTKCGLRRESRVLCDSILIRKIIHVNSQLTLPRVV